MARNMSFHIMRRICEFLTILPTKYNKYGAIVILLMILTQFCYSFYGLIRSMLANLNNSNNVMMLVLIFITYLNTFIAIIFVNFINGNEVKRFIVKFLRLTYYQRNKFLTYNQELLMFHAIYCTFFIYNMVRAHGVENVIFMLIKNVNYYYMLMVCMLVRYFMLNFKSKYMELNGRLADVGNISTIPKVDLHSIRTTYTTLNGLVKDYNKIFGVQYVMIFSNIMVVLLASLNLLCYTVAHVPNYEYSVLLVCALWAILPCVLMFVMVKPCENCVNEAIKTGYICCSLLKPAKLADVRRELEAFVQEALQTKIFVSAAGYFEVNYKLISSLISSAVTYLVILVQFNKI